MEYTGSLGRIFNLLLPKCRTKFLYKAGKPYSISIFSNREKWCFPQNRCFDKCWMSSYLLEFWELSYKLTWDFVTRFLANIHLYFYISCTISIFKFVFRNKQIVHKIYKNTSIFKILFVYKFHHKTSYG